MLLAVTLIVPAVALASLNTVTPVAAADGTSFDPGYIISDGLFFDGNAMTADEVQAFLNAQVPICDTWHVNASGYEPPFICLKDYQVTHAAKPADAYCDAVPAATHSAAQLIALVGQACGISQKVLLVLLQKEQGLVTDTWPVPRQYRSATGYGCPDTAPCDAQYYGLFNQLYKAAWVYNYYVANPDSYNYKAGQLNDILYNPNRDCGTQSVDIRNSATAALYIYTPYVPNAAALANLYGTGDGCSSYGNRNFWRIYSDWFGSPTDLVPTGVSVTRIGGRDRYASSAAISASYFSPAVPVVYVASGADFADAISAAPAAAHGGGPVLLVGRDEIPPVVMAELTRLAPLRIVVVGGPGAISERVADELATVSAQIDRVFGQDRYETSRALLSYAFGAVVPEVYVATGSMFADALSASAAAGSRNDPVLLVDGAQPRVDDITSALLQTIGTTKVYISGGIGVVTTGIEQSLATQLGADSVIRLAGNDRYATSTAVNRERFTSATTFFVASGEAFPDALGAAPIAGAQAVPLYVTPSSCMPRALIQHIIDAGASQVVIIGGTGAVSDSAAHFRNC